MNQRTESINVILWDWNGTLLDDVEVCIESMNSMLSKRKKPLLTREHYKEIFTFPVIDYYRKIGWDLEKESWDKLAFEFIDLYLRNLPQAPLHRGAVDVLDFFSDRKYRQAILSAMEQEALAGSVKQKGISRFFEKIAGIGDHYAYSKADIALKAMNELNVSFSQVCLIGDTLHDLEVAHHVGCECILVAAGHQTRKRLREKHDQVIGDLMELKRFF